jgi:MoaD family protein
MTLTIKTYLTMRQVMGNKRSMDLEYRSIILHDLLILMADQFGSEFRSMVFNNGTNELWLHVKILINGRHHTCFPDKLNTEIKDGDEIGLFPPIAGG